VIAPRFVDVPLQRWLPLLVSRERVNGCPMEIKSRFRRFLFNMFGIMP
jgi:hypothetical protein